MAHIYIKYRYHRIHKNNYKIFMEYKEFLKLIKVVKDFWIPIPLKTWVLHRNKKKRELFLAKNVRMNIRNTENFIGMKPKGY